MAPSWFLTSKASFWFVKKFKELDSSGDLETIMNITNKLGGPVCTHEGWILGAMA